MGDLPEHDLGNVTDGSTESIQRRRRIEPPDVLKLPLLKVSVCRKPAAAQHHEPHTVRRKLPVSDRQVIIIYLFQAAPSRTSPELCDIIGKVVIHGVLHRLKQDGDNLPSLFCFKPAYEPFYDRLFIFPVQPPQEDRTAPVITLMSVGQVKIIFQRTFSPLTVKAKYRDPPAVLIHPALKEPVPCPDLCNSRRIRTLGIDQELLVETALIIPAGRRKEILPFLPILYHSRGCALIQFA